MPRAARRLNPILVGNDDALLSEGRQRVREGILSEIVKLGSQLWPGEPVRALQEEQDDGSLRAAGVLRNLLGFLLHGSDTSCAGPGRFPPRRGTLIDC